MSKLMRIITLLAAVSATGALLASGGESEGKRRLPEVTNAKWVAECSACHLAYHPALLPERSWREIMAGLDKHFGDNASLDAATRDEITRFLVENGADKTDNRRSRRIDESIRAGDTPLRISDTRYFRREHDEVADAVWKRESVGSPANCGACHRTADIGDFSERNVRIPR